MQRPTRRHDAASPKRKERACGPLWRRTRREERLWEGIGRLRLYRRNQNICQLLFGLRYCCNVEKVLLQRSENISIYKPIVLRISILYFRVHKIYEKIVILNQLQ